MAAFATTTPRPETPSVSKVLFSLMGIGIYGIFLHVSGFDATLLRQVLSTPATEAAAGTVFRWNMWFLDKVVRMPCIVQNLL